MNRVAPIGAVLLLLALPSCVSPDAPGEPPRESSALRAEAQCRAERDRRLDALEYEAQSIRTMIDTDAATVDAPEFQLRKTERALLKDIEADKEAARARYRACLRPGRPGGPARP